MTHGLLAGTRIAEAASCGLAAAPSATARLLTGPVVIARLGI
jgi:hypothetical protein